MREAIEDLEKILQKKKKERILPRKLFLCLLICFLGRFTAFEMQDSVCVDVLRGVYQIVRMG